MRARLANANDPLRLALIRWFTRFHLPIYQLTHGRLLGFLAGLPVMVLFTRGRRSGQVRPVMLTYLPDGSTFVVVGSNGGAAQDPPWARNLAARPHAVVQLGGEHVPVAAARLGGDERARVWAALVAIAPFYDNYAGSAAAHREIPLWRLTPRD